VGLEEARRHRARADAEAPARARDGGDDVEARITADALEIVWQSITRHRRDVAVDVDLPDRVVLRVGDPEDSGGVSREGRP
jgi:hypothetical protein